MKKVAILSDQQSFDITANMLVKWKIEMEMSPRQSAHSQLSLDQKLRIIERKGSPEYLFDQKEAAGNQPLITPLEIETEISNVYEAAYNKARGRDKRKILRRFFASAPHIAFRRFSWSWSLWQNAVANKRISEEARLSLESIARGIKNGQGYKLVVDQTRLEAAKIFLTELMNDNELRSLYRDWREAINMAKRLKTSEDSRQSYRKKILSAILKKLRQQNPDRIGPDELKVLGHRLIKGLRPAIEYLASLLFQVPTRYLQSKERFPNSTAKI